MLTIIFTKAKDVWAYAQEIRFFYMLTYQTILGLVCAFSIFQFFLNLDLKYNKLINSISSHTLGIYIIHQVPILYYNGWIWNEVFHFNAHFDTPDFYIVSIGIALITVLVAIFLDILCDKLINKIISSKRISELCDKVNNVFLM